MYLNLVRVYVYKVLVEKYVDWVCKYICNINLFKFIFCLLGFFLYVNIVMWVKENFMCNIKLLLIFVKMKVM